jgi:hypothetical protein
MPSKMKILSLKILEILPELKDVVFLQKTKRGDVHESFCEFAKRSI